MRVYVEYPNNSISLDGLGINAAVGVVKDVLKGEPLGQIEEKPIRITIEPEVR